MVLVAWRLREIGLDPPVEERVDGLAAVIRRRLLDSEPDAFLTALQLVREPARLRLRKALACGPVRGGADE
jgi:hypothetical protein